MSNSGLDHFLEDISPESPCGENLEQAPQFYQLENETKFQPERQMGDVIVPEKAPDWKKVREMSLSLLERSHDIQIAMHLTCALVNIEGFIGLEKGSFLIYGFLQKYWDKVYPLKDPEDDYPVSLINTLSTLNDDKRIIEPIRKSLIFKSKVAEISWDFYESARNRVEALSHLSSQEDFFEYIKKNNFENNVQVTLEEAKIKAKADLEAADKGLLDADLPYLTSTAACIKNILDQCNTIVAITSDKVGSENALDISDLILLIKNIHKLLAEKIELKEKQLAINQSDSSDQGSDSIAMSEGTKKIRKGNGINSREDVIFAIDGICKYFESYEPSSPVPFLLQRAKKLLSMNFMEILQDLTPDAVNQAEKICGVKKNE